jgi:hypothetical protein
MTPQSAYNASGAASWAACLLQPKSKPDTVGFFGYLSKQIYLLTNVSLF